MKTAFLMVTYNKNRKWDWTRLCVTSLRECFDEPLIVVDHNYNAEEALFLRNKATLIKGNRPWEDTINHGTGLDQGIEWCKENNIDVVVLIEPDCTIHGRNDYNNLISAIEEGNWMASTFRYPYGALHPCISAWKVSEIKHSFQCCPKQEDCYHPKYNEVINVKSLVKTICSKNLPEFYFLYWWDTGIKNWFECAINNKSKFVSNSDTVHYWGGHKRNPESFMKTWAGPYLTSIKVPKSFL